MAELKTKKTEADPGDFLGKIKDAAARKDCAEIAELLQRATGAAAKMWAPSIVGFGSRRLKYPSGRGNRLDDRGILAAQGRDRALPAGGATAKQAALLKKLGKHSTGKGCLYIRSLADVDTKMLDELIRESVAHREAGYAFGRKPLVIG